MFPHLRSFRFLFSAYAAVRHQRREVKLLSLVALPSCTSTAYIHSSKNGHLLLVPSAGPCEQVLSPADFHSSSPHGTNNDGTKDKKRRRRRWRNRKERAKEEGLCVPLEEEVSISTVNSYESGDPLGRKELGQQVVQWLKKGMNLMASTFASSAIQNDRVELSLDGGSSDGHMSFVIQAQPYLSVTPMPNGHEALCLKASTHYPTLFDNFQRELRDVLLQHQNEGHITDWRSAQSWMLLKELAKSAEHRAAARKTKTPIMHSTIGISLDKTRLMQTKIDDFVKTMTDLLHIERDAELEFTQEELNATPFMDANLKKPVQAVDYLVTHGQADEHCDTICNLKVISSSTGLTGDHLVLFRVEGSHKLPPSRLSPGDMRNCEALMLLQKKGLQKSNVSIGIVATLFGDKEDVAGLEQNNLIDLSESDFNDDGLLVCKYNLDSSQSKALALALNKKRPVLVIQGPPGTGKTGLLSYLIERVVRRGERVLVTAPSNAAIDNIVEKLATTGMNIVRVGNPSRISPSVASRSLGDIVTRRLQKITEEFERKKSDLRKDLKHCIQDDSLASGIRQLLKKLGKDYKKKEKEMIKEVISNAEVILSTNIGAVDPLIRKIGCFDLATWMTKCAFLLLDTRMPYGSLNIDCEESLDPEGTGSFYNNGEADIVAHHVLDLVKSGVSPTSIAVQSPYVAQVQLLRDRLGEYPLAYGVEVSTIDSFQGREADAVVISMVRSNSLGAVGFLGDSRRMNVAITRARSHVAVKWRLGVHTLGAVGQRAI
ncbi:hypothetical protein EJB05_44430 [Eragrostis curvula]|uniref:Helicase ATP-binding domain-containing protein n=1 Tax=Eragrostis curvula TaxID=38414 RepID=A0A5J9TI25_9POAL|nr:hypothetical protein EJB05_44430 [Eragrostis curvula]